MREVKSLCAFEMQASGGLWLLVQGMPPARVDVGCDVSEGAPFCRRRPSHAFTPSTHYQRQ